MSKFFINRPIFAIVIAIMITLAGLISMVNLPIARYPQISPPSVQVSTAYTGATAQVVNDTVASVIETQIVGVQDLDFMTSTSSSNGTYSLSLQFNQGSNADMDTVNTQNRVQAALAQLPSEVQQVGVTTTKSSGDMAYIFSLNSPNGTFDSTFLKNYGTNYLMDAIKGVKGVGSVQEFGSDYAMRIWLDPSKMQKLGVTLSEVTAAIKSQNVQAAAGTVGKNPTNGEQAFQYPIKIDGRLVTEQQFGNIVIKNSNGTVLHLKDIARIDVGAKGYDFTPKASYRDKNAKSGEILFVEHRPTAGFAVSLQNDANALETIANVQKILAEQSKSFPQDLEYHEVVDNTKFVRASINEVEHTFFEALVLVLIVVYVFLQSWRSTLIPMIAVPVSLLGTFGAFVLLDFSINTLTLFAMVLAIGLVVDDAIVVVEAVEYELKYNGLSPKEAAIKAMENVQGPVIGIAFVLSAVFIPVAFMGGMTGILYKQFALTIAVSVAISAIVALVLTPALCATMLKPHVQKEREDFVHRQLNKFNRGLERFSDWYGKVLARLSHRLSLTVITLFVFAAGTGIVFHFLPTSFVPAEDSGYFLIAVNEPPGATSARTVETLDKIKDFLEQTPGIKDNVEQVFTVSGFDLLGGGQKSSAGASFAVLKDWDQRKSSDQSVNAMVGAVFGFAAKNVPEASVVALNPPSIPGLGNTGGFTMYIINKSGDSAEVMAERAQAFIAEARTNPAIRTVYTTFDTATPSLQFQINREKAAKDGVALPDIFTALQGFYGSIQVNDYTSYGKNYKVIVQADDAFRQNADNLNMLAVRNSKGQMVSVANYITKEKTGTPSSITRFDNAMAVQIGGSAANGYSSGDAIQALKDAAAKTLPQGYTYDWGGQTREELKAGSQTLLILGLGLTFVFLILAALYESWKVPFAVLFSVPSGMIGAALVPFLLNFTGRFQLANDIYMQIGLLTLVGLAAKNAILIIEYAKIRVDERGMDIVDAAIEAAKIRLRPILMTSFAFIFGVLPLAISSGAGSGARTSMGITVVAGMTTATFFGIFIIPMLFIIIEKVGPGFFTKRKKNH
ncbi:multidrug efflux RND transporter permease subunit [Veillonella tobetsuensis]|uniref:Multidrug efflux RND transporter permease subunit n=1 Tax=Veillonella tobetsuensis TaxID=1110546 RepID=A0A480BE28_9FIRM|nr:efflux RND transporter permease subunit [Veillonella tobetsuensis]GCL69478.1 multidrug efflux RND transporter permease subunit [Veillonella tobetsuensis]